MTTIQNLEKSNLILTQALEKLLSWVLVDNDLVEFYTENAESVSEMVSYCNEVLSLNQPKDINQLEMFEERTDKFIPVDVVKDCLADMVRRLESTKNCINNISKDSVINNLKKVGEINEEAIELLKENRLKR